MTDAERKRRHRNERIAAFAIVLVLASIAGAIVYWRGTQDEALRETRDYVPKATAITPEILLLQEYVRIDTTKPEGVAKGARWLASYMRSHGLNAELIESAPGRVNVYARVKGREPGNALLLFNHIDVVPADTNWEQPAFSGAIVANQMYGRGTLDMKALALCQVLAMIDLARSGRPPKHDLVFLATADEETGSEFGMRWIIGHRPDVLEGVTAAIGEGGVTEMMSEQMTYFGIEIGGKQFVQFELDGEREPLYRLRRALEPYLVRREPDRVLPLVRRYFSDIAPARVQFRSLLENIDRTIAQGQFWRLPVTYRDLAQDSLWLGAPIEIDHRWRMLVRMANLPDTDPDARIAWMADFAKPYGVRIHRMDVKEGPVPLSSPDTPLFAMLAAEAKQRYRVRTGTVVLYRAVSDARFLRPRGITCYGVSPYPVNFFQSIRIHGVNERIRLDWFGEGVGYMRNVVRAWANA